MALKLVCDGCHCDGTDETLARIGLLDPVHYCHDCAAAWRAYEQLEHGKRVELVSAFEAWRASALSALKTAFKKLPDQ